MATRLLVVSPDRATNPGGGAVAAERLRERLGVTSLHLQPGAGDGVLDLLGQSALGRTFWAPYLPVGFRSRRRLRELMAEFRPTIVHANGFGHPLVDSVAHLAIRQGVRTVFTVHGLPNLSVRPFPIGELGRVYLDYRRPLLDDASVVACPSEAVARDLALLSPRQVEVIPWGVDPPDVEEATVRRAFPALVAVARLVPAKRLELLIQALPAVLCAWPRASLDIVGPVSAPWYARKLAALVRRLGLERTVRFVGPLPASKCWQAMRAADVYVSASVQESFGLATLEAASVGLPVVATDVGIASRIIEPESGRLLPISAGMKDIAASVLDLLSVHRDASTAAAMVASRILDEFSWERTVSRYAALFGIEMAGR